MILKVFGIRVTGAVTSIGAGAHSGRFPESERARLSFLSFSELSLPRRFRTTAFGSSRVRGGDSDGGSWQESPLKGSRVGIAWRPAKRCDYAPTDRLAYEELWRAAWMNKS